MAISLRELCMQQISQKRDLYPIFKLPLVIQDEIRDDYFIEERIRRAYDVWEVRHLKSLRFRRQYRLVGSYDIQLDKTVVLLEDPCDEVNKYWANKKMRFIVSSNRSRFEMFYANLYKCIDNYENVIVEKHATSHFYFDGEKVKFVPISGHVIKSKFPYRWNPTSSNK